MTEPFNIVDLFYETSRQTPSKTALIYKGKKISFGEFEKNITATAHYFLTKGIQKGDRVMVFIPMSTDLYRIVLALFKIGATAVFLDEWVGVKRLNDCCRLAQCKAFIGTPKGRLLALFVSELRKIPIKLGVRYDLSSPSLPFPKTIQDDVALITFTTGSTGIPKAAIRTHGLLREQFNALMPLIAPEQDDICMPVLPIVLLLNLGAGVTSVIADYKASKPASLQPKKIVRQINAYGVRSIIASPYFVKEISKYLLASNTSLRQIAKIFTGGAPVFPTEAATFLKAFPETRIRIVYGSTEAEPISSIDAGELVSHNTEELLPGLDTGIPDVCTTVKIIRIMDADVTADTPEKLAELEVIPGHTGEIIVTGKHVLKEYLHNSVALQRNKIFVGETCWHRTGDSGYIGQNGHLFLTGRCNMRIVRNEKTIAPFMYENYFQTLDGVEMGTVMMRDNKLTAILELKNPARKEAVKAAIGMLPQKFEAIIFVRKIPRDPRHHSKIDYEKLR